MASGCRVDSSSAYQNPAYRKISALNGEVNRMSKEEIRQKLKELHLEYRGHRDVISARLKKFYKEQQLVRSKVKKPSLVDTYYDYILVVDFEATCDESNQPDFKNEIIEFPIVLINTSTLEIESEFQEYCKPMLNPTLTEFCTTLTGISQRVIDRAEMFPAVLQHVDKWMLDYNLFKDSTFNYIVASDGPWDMAKFMKEQCELCGVEVPLYGKKWINIRKAFASFYNVKRGNISYMLNVLDKEFEGRQHSGLDDSRNIARIVVQLLKDGCKLRVNERLSDFENYVWFGGRPNKPNTEISSVNWRNDERPVANGESNDESDDGTKKQRNPSTCDDTVTSALSWSMSSLNVS